jgi:hypothetical protein
MSAPPRGGAGREEARRTLAWNLRNSVSYTKDEMLMPGASMRGFANMKF